MATFAERLKQLRKEHGLTQKALGEVISVTSTMVSCYEKGIYYPEVKNFFALARFFEVSLDYLAGWSDKREID